MDPRPPAPPPDQSSPPKSWAAFERPRRPPAAPARPASTESLAAKAKQSLRSYTHSKTPVDPVSFWLSSRHDLAQNYIRCEIPPSPLRRHIARFQAQAILSKGNFSTLHILIWEYYVNHDGSRRYHFRCFQRRGRASPPRDSYLPRRARARSRRDRHSIGPQSALGVQASAASCTVWGWCGCGATAVTASTAQKPQPSVRCTSGRDLRTLLETPIEPRQGARRSARCRNRITDRTKEKP